MVVNYQTTRLEPWGRVRRAPHLVAEPSALGELPALVAEAAEAGAQLLGTGLQRSYGDTALNAGGRVISFRRLDRFIAFDRATGVLRAQAGMSLDAILRLVAPHGWFLPTSPGTRFVTLGGAVANDVHGKNHHRVGSFGRHVLRLGLLRTDAGLLEVSPTQSADLFHATLGGLGLTGLITWVEVALAPIASTYVDEEAVTFGGIAEFLKVAAQSNARFEHVSAWVDCSASGASLGRGVLFRANWAEHGGLRAHERQRLHVPFSAPVCLMNAVTMKVFNAAYRSRQRLRRGASRLHYAPAFYPLDAVGGWNLLYGDSGFYQHQSLIPFETAQAALEDVLTNVARSGLGSFLAVLKTMGDLRSGGLISFDGPGVSLALDFPNRGPPTLKLLERFDQIVTSAGGRIYPAKDGRMSGTTFRAGYPRWAELEAARDPMLSSEFWRRVTA